MRPLGSPFPPVAPVAATCRGGPAVRHLHRYYGVLRLRPIPPGRLQLPSSTRTFAGCLFAPTPVHPTDASLARCCRGRLPVLAKEMGSSPVFLGSPLGSVPRAGDSGGPRSPRAIGGPSVAFRQANGVGNRHANDFGADSSRPASSLSTLRTHQSPSEWQDSLPACPLRP